VQEKSEPLEKLLITTAVGVRSILVDKILYVEADGHQSILHLQHEKIILKQSLGNFEQQVAGQPCFVKCHRAYVVNLKYVAMILKTDMLLDNNEKIPVSRNMLKKVQQEFLRYYKALETNNRLQVNLLL
jgi:DNA-binding LytR/AlgR family response regulator